MPPRASHRILVTLVMVALCVGIVQLDPTAATPRAVLRPAVTSSVTPILSPSLRDITAIPPTSSRHTHPVLPIPRQGGVPRQPASAMSDPVVQQQPGSVNMPATIHNFEGVSNVDGVLPPDPEGDVGPNHYVQWVNLSLAIWDKSGTLLAGPIAGNALWSNVSDPCATQNDGDPIVLYDHLANRWFLSQPARPDGGPYYQCIAVSKSPDPLGQYWLYDFRLSDTLLNDYPHFGVWPDGYYMSINQFANGTTWNGAGAVVFEREQMLLGQLATALYFDLFAVDSTFGGMLPSDLDGPPPPAGAPNYFAEVDDANFLPPNDALRIWQFHVDWANLNNSTFGINGQPDTILDTAPFDLLPCLGATTLNCIPQKGTSRKLDSLGDRLMYRLQYRNFGDHESLVVNHTVDAGSGRAGIRWYELRDPGGNPTIYQQGTYGPADTEHRWMGSAALDRQGNLAIGFSVSGSNTYPSIRYSGRLASDPLGTLPQGEATLRAGGGSQTNSQVRWGDYTMLAVDPTDDCTFWYTNEYLSSTSDSAWQTRIGSFRFPSCTGSRTGNVIGRVTNADNSAPIANATVRAGANTTTTNSSGIYRFFNLPVGTYNLAISAPGFTAKTVNGVSVVDRATTTQNVALQPVGEGPQENVFLPLMVKARPTPIPTPTPTATPRCDPYEPNDDRTANPFGPLTSGQVYLAKLCHDDSEDNYYFVTATPNQIQITLHLPPALVGHTLLWVYAQADLRQGHEICSRAPVSTADTVLLCSIPHSGGYDVRLYTESSSVFDDLNSYSLAVSYQ